MSNTHNLLCGLHERLHFQLSMRDVCRACNVYNPVLVFSDEFSLEFCDWTTTRDFLSLQVLQGVRLTQPSNLYSHCFRVGYILLRCFKLTKGVLGRRLLLLKRSCPTRYRGVQTYACSIVRLQPRTRHKHSTAAIPVFHWYHNGHRTAVLVAMA